MRFLKLFLVLLYLLPVPVHAQQRRALSVPEFIELDRPGEPAISPDGRAVAFASCVYPDCHDDTCNESHANRDEHRPSKARLYDGLLFRHWTQWADSTRSHIFVVDAAGGTPRDLLAGKDYDSPVPP